VTSPSLQLRFLASHVPSGQPSERARLPPGHAGQQSLPSHRFAPINSILPRIGITKQIVKRLEAIQMVREQRENGKQELAYHARPFVLCGIPLRRPPTGQLLHRRQNGKFFLEIVAHPSFGLPFGQDRLIPLWAATLAVRQKSREIHFSTAAQILDFVQLPKDGLHYRRIIEGFQRIFAASIFFGTDGERASSSVFDWSRVHFFDRMELWFNRAEPRQAASGRQPINTIVLSESFYAEVNQHPIPAERHVVASLANAPGLLDFYVWIVWKSWTLKSGPAQIPLFGSQGLQGQLGVAKYSRDKRFRQTLGRWLGRIRLLWPECPAEPSRDGKFLIVSSSTRAPAIRRMSA
jgi:hypothetical protein